MRVEDVNNIVLTLMRIMVRVTRIFILEMFPKLDIYKYIYYIYEYLISYIINIQY